MGQGDNHEFRRQFGKRRAGRVLAIYKAKITAGSPSEPSQQTEAAIRELMFGGQVTLTANMVKRIYMNLK